MKASAAVPATMFLEHTGPRTQQKGWIEVICGSMFSGKTEELIRRLRRAEFAKQRVEIFKPSVDNRYAVADVVSHNATTIRSTPVPNSSNLLLLASDIQVVGIDEAQFFDAGLPQVCEQLANTGVRVIAAGLDMDFQGRPFGPMPQLMSIAEYVTTLASGPITSSNSVTIQLPEMLTSGWDKRFMDPVL